MTVIEVSAPCVKSPIPTIIISVPIRKATRRLGWIGVMRRHRRATMTTIGNTEIADSLIFSPNTANLLCGLIFLSSYIDFGKFPSYYIISFQQTRILKKG